MIEQYLCLSGAGSNNGQGSDGRGNQVNFTTPGSYQFIVPKDVTTLSVVVVSAGQQGRFPGATNQMTCGRGGCVRYKNNIAVKPGDTYTIKIGDGGTAGTITFPQSIMVINDYMSSAFGVLAGLAPEESSPIADGVNGRTGANGQGGTAANSIYGGGDSASFTFNGSGQGNSSVGSQGVSLTNGRITGVGLNGGACGGGGSCSTTGTATNSNKYYGRGGDGGVRIIWGRNRAFPSTNIADV